MAKITKVTILDQTTLRLDQDAKTGDTIDLLSLNEVDTSSLSLAIAQGADKEYERRLLQHKERFELEKNKAVQEAVETLKKDNALLNQAIEKTKQEVESQLSLAFEKEKSNLERKIQELSQEKESLEKAKSLEIENALNKKEKESLAQIKELEQKIAISVIEKSSAIDRAIAQKENELLVYRNDLREKQQEIQNLISLSEKDTIIAVQKKEKELKTIIQELEEKVSNLELTKSALNIKKIGEKLEDWCNNEYQAYALNGFHTATWEKDTIAIRDPEDSKGTKADYIFKVYASTEKRPEELLTSVVCEMKSEDPSSVHKKKNSDHYKKLDIDRNKKNCEYALLISELEWESTNDSPIRKVFEYDKMYVVRPQYFIVFLSIVTSLGLRYKDLLLEMNEQKEQFKDTEEILKEFEDMKNNILDNSLKGLDKEVNDILDQADKIHGMSKKIMDSAQNIIDRRLDLVRRKIEGFNINRINNKINKIE